MFNLKSLQKTVLLITISVLVACGGEVTTKPIVKAPSAPTVKSTPAKPGAGGYYLDDGPGDNAPANIDSIPDATLKTEVPLVRANKPYMALGQQYVPMTSFIPYKKQGVASWYGKRYHGKKTSTGEIYDMYAMSGAHTVLPIPSYAKVTNPANGRSVIVRINDRGPFKHDRLIDLSYAAAYKLRLIGQGSGLVEVEAIDTSPAAMQNIAKNSAATAQSPSAGATPLAQTAVVPTPIPSAAISTSTSPTATVPTNSNITNTQYYVQAGAFKNEANGDLLQKKIQGLELAENVGLANVYNNGLYRVRLGPYATKTDADTSAAIIRKQLNISAIVQTQ